MSTSEDIAKAARDYADNTYPGSLPASRVCRQVVMDTAEMLTPLIEAHGRAARLEEHERRERIAEEIRVERLAAKSAPRAREGEKS